MLKGLAHLLLYRGPVVRTLGSRTLQPAWEALHKLALYGMNYGGGNELTISGELWVLQTIASAVRARGDRPQPVVFDIGANTGHYAAAVRSTFGETVRLVCFEPSPAAFASLAGSLAGVAGVTLENLGLGQSEGVATLYSNDEGSVVSSLHQGGTTAFATSAATEECRLTTLDSYCEEHKIDHIDMLKIDAEGSEFDILRGAGRMLAADAVDYIQFEFGAPQMNARSYFKDLYGLLSSKYRVHRILRAGLAPIDSYDEIREVFRTTNYLAVSRRLGGDLPPRRG